MAALAGVVRAGVESGVFPLPAGADIRARLAQLEAQLAELAMRPGQAGVAADVIADAGANTMPPRPGVTATIDAFLAEQADYADAHLAAAHAAVAELHALGTTAPGPAGRRRAHSG
jgi:hypothetical protein